MSATTQDNIGEGQPTLASVKAQNPRVFVISQRGEPLMPTTASRARRLLKCGEAKVVRRTPFTIQLLYPTGETKQAISLGVDAGTKRVGVSATTEKCVLFEAEVKLRTDIQELLASRRMYRRSRRQRKTRYRKARFTNCKKPKGWVAPSIQNKINTHAKVIALMHRLMPVSKIIIELAQFDLQKMNNPDISGAEYQQGPQLGFWNTREYCLSRDSYTCQYCAGKSGDKVLNVHHIESRLTGGDAPDNLLTLCKTCHSTIHRDKLAGKIKRKRPSSRDAMQMNIMRRFLHEAVCAVYKNVDVTFGYITKCVRIQNNLAKSHTIDARCISGNPLAQPVSSPYLIKQARRQNRQLHRAKVRKGGKRQASKAQRYMFGFQLFDKVIFKGQECFVVGRRSTGSFIIRLLDGTVLSNCIRYKKLKIVEKATILLIQSCAVFAENTQSIKEKNCA